MSQLFSAGARRLWSELGVAPPLFLAGMGGIAGPELVAAVSNAGGAGILGLYKAPAARIASLVTDTERLTTRAYGLNWVPEVLGTSELEERVSVALSASRASTFISFFGLPTTSVCELVHRAGRRLFIQVGSVKDAQAAVALGAQAVIVQGVEAGGHLLGTETVPVILANVRRLFPELAVVVAGSVGTGADLGAWIEAGADGACCGTLFIPAVESRAHPTFKRAVLRARADDTVISDLFEIGWPGRRHRVIRTPRVEAGRTEPASFVAKTRVYGAWLPIPRYSAAVPTVETSGAIEEMAFYCGQSCSTVNAELSAHSIVHTFAAELERYFQRRSSLDASEGKTWISHSLD